MVSKGCLRGTAGGCVVVLRGDEVDGRQSQVSLGSLLKVSLDSLLKVSLGSLLKVRLGSLLKVRLDSLLKVSLGSLKPPGKTKRHHPHTGLYRFFGHNF